MFGQSIRAVITGVIFSASAIATASDVVEHKGGAISNAKIQPIENLVDIHDSPIILKRPTQIASNNESIAELRKLRRMGELRERKMRSQYQARGQVYPEPFAGD